jgi:hypothetical protein
MLLWESHTLITEFNLHRTLTESILFKFNVVHFPDSKHLLRSF